MVDTVEMYVELDGYESYKKVVAAINDFATEMDGRKLHKEKRYKSYNAKKYITGAFGKKFGVLEVAVVKYVASIRSPRLVVKYKPSVALGKKSDYALSDFTDYARAIEGFNRFAASLKGFLLEGGAFIPPAIYWQVSRIDYAYDFFTQYYDKYIALLRKGYDTLTDDRFPSSVYIAASNININFYDKSVQTGNEEEKSHNIRLEVQCKKGYLRHLARKNDWALCNIYYLWDDHIADNIVKYELEKLVGRGDFYSLTAANKIITAKLSLKKAEKLSNVLKISLNPQVKLTRIAELYSHLDDSVTPKYVKRQLLPELNKLGISPLAIPQAWKIDYLPNPWKLLKKEEKRSINGLFY